MCKAGGPRCQSSDALTLVKRKIQRSRKYRDANDYAKRRIMDVELDKWKNQHKDFVQDHARKRASFNTRAKPKSTEKVKAFKSSEHSGVKKLLGPPTEDTYDVNELIAEHNLMKRILKEDGDTYNALQRYSFISFSNINSYLRKDRNNKDYPEDDLVSITENDTQRMDEAFIAWDQALSAGSDEVSGESSDGEKKEHVVYRETNVPAGWSSKEYIQKYYGIGEVVADPAYMSTSHSPSYIVEKVNTEKKRRPEQESLILKVLTRDGISLQRELPGNSSIQSREMERLLPRNHRLVAVEHSRHKFVDAGLTEENLMHSHHRGPKSRTVTVVQLVDETIFSDLVRQK